MNLLILLRDTRSQGISSQDIYLLCPQSTWEGLMWQFLCVNLLFIHRCPVSPHGILAMKGTNILSVLVMACNHQDCQVHSLQYIPRNMHTVFALLCFVVVIHWLIFPYPSGLLHWHCGNLTIAPVPAKQPWWIWINTSCEFIMNDCITTTKQSTTKPCAYFLGYTVIHWVTVWWHRTGSILVQLRACSLMAPNHYLNYKDTSANIH